MFDTRVFTKFEDIENIFLQDIKSKANIVNFNEEQTRKDFLQKQETSKMKILCLLLKPCKIKPKT